MHLLVCGAEIMRWKCLWMNGAGLQRLQRCGIIFFMYERIIPEVLGEYDPETFYWPASPSSGGSL